MMTDPIADMLTRLRNASRVEKPAVEMAASGVKTALAAVLKEEGFILDYQVGKHVTHEDGTTAFEESHQPSDAHVVLRVYLKYGPEGERVMRELHRISKPGCRVYRRSSQLKPVLDGLGVAVLSTSRGVMSDRKARAEKVGGEVLCEIW